MLQAYGLIPCGMFAMLIISILEEAIYDNHKYAQSL